MKYWNARIAQDWTTLYEFAEPDLRTQVSLAQFEQWSRTNEPFDVRSFQMDHVEVQGDRGWAQVRYAAGLTRFPDAPIREVDHWQKWRLVQGEWYPVPPRELGAYPAAPSLRNASEEAKLLERFEESWLARSRRDWKALYRFGDPDDLSRVSEQQFIAAESLIEHIDHVVDWVEVLGDSGRVRVGYRHRLSDPNLTKLTPTTLYVIEPWIRRDNEWYRDLDRTLQ